MTTLEEIQNHLSKYLSSSGTTELLKEIDEQFPKIHPTRMYTSIHDSEKTIFQGDGIRDLLLVHLPCSWQKTFVQIRQPESQRERFYRVQADIFKKGEKFVRMQEILDRIW